MNFGHTAWVMLSLVDPDPPAGPEGRRYARKSMLVAATLRVGGHALAVRIRNMSASGALIETATLPPAGAVVILERGSLQAAGRVSWSAGLRCGLALDAHVPVEIWMSNKLPGHQEAIDTMIAQARRGLDEHPLETVPLIEPPSGIGRRDVAVGADIDTIIERIRLLEQALIHDCDMVSRHGVALQAIDEALQRLEALKARLDQP